MTDKELAEKYEEKAECVEMNDDGKKVYDSIDIQEAFLAGLEMGRKEKWNYIKDGELPNTDFGRAHVTIAYINAYGNPCKMDCCFDGTDFIYWDDRKPIGWKKVDIFGKIYAWKYQEKLPEPPKESEK